MGRWIISQMWCHVVVECGSDGDERNRRLTLEGIDYGLVEEIFFIELLPKPHFNKEISKGSE